MTLKLRPFAILVVVLLFSACDSDDNKDVTPLGSVKIEGKEYSTNTSRFNAQPGGYIFGVSAPVDGDIAEFWTSEGVTFSIQEAGEGLTRLRAVFYRSGDHPVYKFNVRFVKD